MGRKAAVWNAFLSLCLGFLIYILYKRPPPAFRFFLSWEQPLVLLSFLPVWLSAFIRFHLADMLWSYSLASVLYAISGCLPLSCVISIGMTVLFEAAQYASFVYGTGDVLDILFSLCSVSIFYFIWRKHYEQKT